MVKNQHVNGYVRRSGKKHIRVESFYRQKRAKATGKPTRRLTGVFKQIVIQNKNGELIGTKLIKIRKK